MNTYISILRGINVSGRNIIKMDKLKEIYQDLGFDHVKTYIQSGNVVFQTNIDSEEFIQEKISFYIKEKLGFDVPVLVLTIENLRNILSQNPFSALGTFNYSSLYITFLSEKIVEQQILQSAVDRFKSETEQVYISEKAIYLYCPNGYGKTKLTNNFFESKLKTVATTRNYATSDKLLNLALEIDFLN